VRSSVLSPLGRREIKNLRGKVHQGDKEHKVLSVQYITMNFPYGFRIERFSAAFHPGGVR